MDFLEDFIKNVYIFLINNDGTKTNIIRKHTKNLTKSGDLSFPLNASNWKVLISDNEKSANLNFIFQYLDRNETDLINLNASNRLKLKNGIKINDNYHLFFNKSICYQSCLNDVIGNEFFGSFELKPKEIYLKSDLIESKSNDISALRVKLIMKTTRNLIHFCSGIVVDDEHNLRNECFNILFSLNSNKNCNLCLCGVVLNEKGLKDRTTTADEYIQNHIVRIRLISEHKYGLRITSKSGWKEFFDKLGHASAILELLQNKISSTIALNIKDPTISNNKGSAFILYNSARLSKLLKDFELKVASKIYPPLPDFNETDFSLLNEPEEWELFYVYVLQFPACIKNCLKDLNNYKIQPHFLVQHLSGFCTVFSCYYRRVKILTEPREHLFPVLFAKIYLVKALKMIMDIALKLLDIDPIKQM